MFRTVSIPGVLALMLSFAAGAQTVPPPSNVGSTPQGVTQGDTTLAQGKAIRDSQGFTAEGNFLLQSFQASNPGDEDMDGVAYRLADFALAHSDMKAPLLNHCTPDQLVRLEDRAETDKNHRKVILFGEEFLNDAPQDARAPSVKFDVARSHMMVDVNEKKALAMWGELIQDSPDSPGGKMAAIWTEAIKGPQSIAAMDAAFEVGFSQDHDVGNTLGSAFSYSRIIDASQRSFFQDYVRQSSVPSEDRAEMLYYVLYSYLKLARYNGIPETAAEIFSIAGYNSKVAQRTAFAVAMADSLQNHHDQAISEYEDYLRAFPNGDDAARAMYGLARSYHYKADMADALVYYGATAQMYPDTNEGIHAQEIYKSILDHDTNGAWLAEAKRRRPSRMAKLKEPLNPKLAWPGKELKSRQVAEEVPGGGVREPAPEEMSRFRRLSAVLRDLSPEAK